MREAQHRKGAYQREPKKFGELVTCDYLVGKLGSMKACTGHLNALCILDLFTRYKACKPVVNHDTEATVDALNNFRGKYKIPVARARLRMRARKLGLSQSSPNRAFR